jgi:hypothetical protein
LTELVSEIECGPFGGNAIAGNLYEEEGLPFIRPVNLSRYYFDDHDLVRVSETRLREMGLKVYSGENLYFGRVGEPCVAMLDATVSISPNVIIAIADTTRADTAYLQAFCTCSPGLSQLRSQLKAGVQPTTSTDTVRTLLVFTPSPQAQAYIGDKVRQADRFRQLANVLHAAANRLVEELINGKITDAELKEAQDALQRGDSVPDRAILSRLSRKGIDRPNEPPLFPNLDGLYTTLKQAAEGHTHNDGEARE